VTDEGLMNAARLIATAVLTAQSKWQGSAVSKVASLVADLDVAPELTATDEPAKTTPPLAMTPGATEVTVVLTAEEITKAHDAIMDRPIDSAGLVDTAFAAAQLAAAHVPGQKITLRQPRVMVVDPTPQERLVEAGKTIDRITKERDEFAKRLDNAYGNHSRAVEGLTASEKALSMQLQTERERHTAFVKRTQKDVAVLVEESNGFRTQLNTSQAFNATLKHYKGQAENKLRLCETNLQETRAQFEAERRTVCEDADRLNIRYSEAVREIAKQKDRVDLVTGERDDLRMAARDAITCSTATIDSLREQLEDLQNRYDELRHRMDGLEK